MIINFLFIFFEKCLKGFELKEQDILNSGKFTVLDRLLQEKKESVI